MLLPPTNFLYPTMSFYYFVLNGQLYFKVIKDNKKNASYFTRYFSSLIFFITFQTMGNLFQFTAYLSPFCVVGNLCSPAPPPSFLPSGILVPDSSLLGQQQCTYWSQSGGPCSQFPFGEGQTSPVKTSLSSSSQCSPNMVANLQDFVCKCAQKQIKITGRKQAGYVSTGKIR